MYAPFKWKDAIFGFRVSPGNAEAQVRWGGKVQYILIAYFLRNMCAKNYRNPTVYVKIIASQRWDFFETRCNSHVTSAKALRWAICLIVRSKKSMLTAGGSSW